MWRPILLATCSPLLGGCALVDAVDAVAGLFSSTAAVADVVEQTNHLLEHTAIFVAGAATSGGGLLGILKWRRQNGKKKARVVAEASK